LTVLLFQSPLFPYIRARHCVPRGLLSLATFLRQRNFDAHVIPLGFDVLRHVTGGVFPDRDALVAGSASILLERVRQTGARVVGCGPLTAEYPMAVDLLRRVKQEFPRVVTVMGGVHATYRAHEVLSTGCVDAVVRGEGEWTLAELCERVSSGMSGWSALHGITWRTARGELVREQSRDPGPLAELPPPDYGLIPADFVRDAWVPLVFSRGCPHRCTFCLETRFWPKPLRWRSIGAIERELTDLVEHYGLSSLALQDSLFAHGHPETTQVCNILSRWSGQLDGYVHLRPDQGRREVFALLDGTGVIKRVSFGVESASPTVLSMMGKPTEFESVIAALQEARSWDMRAHTLWIIGHPGDTPHEFGLTLRAMERLWARGLHESMDLSFFYPYPGTPSWERRDQLGVRMLTDDWEQFGRGDIPVCELETFSANEQLELFYEAHRQARLFREVSTALRKMI
jgi:anaerobic magnesium-protoporphyrin IX monomethyl ester cyclase